MLLDQHELGARAPDRQRPAPPPPRPHRRASPPRRTARRWRSRPASTAGSARRWRSWRRCAASSTRPCGRSRCAPPAPAPTPSRSGRRSSSRPASATSSSTARCASWPGASRPSASTSTSACPTPKRRSTPPTACAPTSRCCWRSRSTRPSGRAATPASPRRRTPLFQAFPRVGIPRAFADYAEYVESVDVLIRCDAVPEPTFLWWDVRPQPRFGTVEVRIMDAQTTLADTAAIAALVQSHRPRRGRGRRPPGTADAAGGARREPLPRRPRRHGRRADRARAGPAGAGPRAARRPGRRLPPPRRGRSAASAELDGVLALGDRTGAHRQTRAGPRPRLAAALVGAPRRTTSCARLSALARGEHELGDDQVRRQLRLRRRGSRSIRTSITTVLRPTWSGVASATISSPRRPAAEDVQLQLDRREVVARRDAAEGRPGGDGVAERGPDAAVDEAAGVQVAAVDDDPAAGVRRPRSPAARSRGRRGSCRREAAGVLGGRPCERSALSPRHPSSTPKPSRPWSPKGSSRSRTASRKPDSAARRTKPWPSSVWRAMPSKKVPRSLRLVQTLRVHGLVDQ